MHLLFNIHILNSIYKELSLGNENTITVVITVDRRYFHSAKAVFYCQISRRTKLILIKIALMVI